MAARHGFPFRGVWIDSLLLQSLIRCYRGAVTVLNSRATPAKIEKGGLIEMPVMSIRLSENELKLVQRLAKRQGRGQREILRSARADPGRHQLQDAGGLQAREGVSWDTNQEVRPEPQRGARSSGVPGNPGANHLRRLSPRSRNSEGVALAVNQISGGTLCPHFSSGLQLLGQFRTPPVKRASRVSPDISLRVLSPIRFPPNPFTGGAGCRVTALGGRAHSLIVALCAIRQ
jgi:hypothetical protein